MSAREFLFARLTGALIPEERANKLIDDLLHEEAEKIRSEKITELPVDADKKLINSVLETVARKIDPYVN